MKSICLILMVALCLAVPVLSHTQCTYISPSDPSESLSESSSTGFDSCKECVKHSDCVWCEKEDTCVNGKLWGPDDHSKCHDWKWSQCHVEEVYVLATAGGAIVVIVLLIILCICCCCCCRRRRKHEEEIPLATDNRYYDPPTMSKTSQRREEMHRKYGVPRERSQA